MDPTPFKVLMQRTVLIRYLGPKSFKAAAIEKRTAVYMLSFNTFTQLFTERLCIHPCSHHNKNSQPLLVHWQLPPTLQTLISHSTPQGNHRSIKKSFLTTDLSFISKLTECIVLSRINDYLTSNSLLDSHQSGFT